MSQSADRARRRGGGPPASFGRPDDQGEDFTIRGGEAFHLALHVDVTPDKASLDALRAAIRETTRAAVLEGYAAAFAEMDDGEQPAGEGDGGAPPPAGPAPGGAGGG